MLFCRVFKRFIDNLAKYRLNYGIVKCLMQRPAERVRVCWYHLACPPNGFKRTIADYKPLINVEPQEKEILAVFKSYVF